MGLLKKFLLAGLVAVIVYCILAACADWYIDQLKSSGGMVTAESILAAKYGPVVLSAFIFLSIS